MGPHDAVCFDLDNTLCVDAMDDQQIHEAVFDRVGVEPFFTPADVAAVDPAALPEAETRRELHEHMFRAVIEDAGGDPALAPDLAAASQAVLSDVGVEFREGAEAALAAARERCDAVGLLTVGRPDEQRGKLRELGIEGAFDSVVVCGPATDLPAKPDPGPFHAMLDELGVAPGDAIYVGDSPGGDVAGADRVGMATAWVPTEADPEDPPVEPTHRLDGPGELVEVL